MARLRLHAAMLWLPRSLDFMTMDEAALLQAIDACECLFLAGIGEPEANRRAWSSRKAWWSESPPVWSSLMDVQSMMRVR